MSVMDAKGNTSYDRRKKKIGKENRHTPSPQKAIFLSDFNFPFLKKRRKRDERVGEGVKRNQICAIAYKYTVPICRKISKHCETPKSLIDYVRRSNKMTGNN